MDFSFNYKEYTKVLQKRNDYELCCDILCLNTLVEKSVFSDSCFVDIFSNLETILFEEVSDRFINSVINKDTYEDL